MKLLLFWLPSVIILNIMSYLSIQNNYTKNKNTINLSKSTNFTLRTHVIMRSNYLKNLQFHQIFALIIK
jgi:hypothetical protein